MDSGHVELMERLDAILGETAAVLRGLAADLRAEYDIVEKPHLELVRGGGNDA